MKEVQQYEKIASYLAGELSEQKRLELEEWLAASPQNQRMFDESKQLWQAAAAYDDVFEGDDKAAWQRFESKMDWRKTKKDDLKETAKIVPMSRFRQWSRIAAALLFLVVAGVWMYQSNMRNHQSWQMVASIDGQQKTITLPDGSTVRLNENTRLTYADDFVTNRQLTLKGEAFFDVVRDEEHPFSIESEKTRTTVLGTTFNIRAYPNETFVEVHVASGKVSFSENMGSQTPLILEKGNVGVLDKKDWRLEKEKAATSNALAWKTKTLHFENTPLQEVVNDLNRCYGKEVTIDNNSLKNCRFKGEFENAKLKEILQALEFALNIKAKKQTDTYLLQGVGCE